MASTYVNYTADGVQDTYTVPFPYLDQTHVKVRVDGALLLQDAHYEFSGTSQIRFLEAQYLPAAGQLLEIRRETALTGPMVSFLNGAILTANDLNVAVRQNFYLNQETRDYYEAFLTGQIGRALTQDVQDILDQATAEILADAALASIPAIQADVDANAESIIANIAQISDEVSARALADSTLQQQINTIAAATAATVFVQPTMPVPGVGGVPNPIPDGARWYDTDDNNKPYVYQQGTLTWLSIEDPRIAANAADITALEATVNNPTTGVNATASALGVLDTTVVNLDGVVSAQGTSITNLESTVNNPLTGVGATATAVDSLDTRVTSAEGVIGGHSTAITTLQTTVNDPSTGVAATAGAVSALDTRVTNNEGNISASASALTLLGVVNGPGTAFVIDGATAYVDATTSLSTKFSTIQSSIGGNTASISTLQTTTDGLSAKYGVSLNVNGYITGFTQNNNGSSGSFVILADKFAIVDPSGDPAEPQFVPFSVSGGVVYMQNVVIGDALISNLTVSKLTSGSFANGQTFTHNGDLNVGSTGRVRGGMTSYATGTGFFLGYEGGAYKFSVGDATKYIRWDGSTFSVGGDIIATGNIIDGAVSSQDYQVTTTLQSQTENVETTVASATVTTVAGKPVALSAFWNFTTFAPLPYNSAPITTYKLKRGATVLLTWVYTGVYSAYDVSRFWIDNPGAGTFTYTITATMRADPNGDNGTPQTRDVHYIALEARQLKR